MKMQMEQRPRDGRGRIGPEPENGPCFSPPEGSELEGSSGEATIGWKRRPDGTIEITSVNGANFGGKTEEPSEMEPSGDMEEA